MLSGTGLVWIVFQRFRSCLRRMDVLWSRSVLFSSCWVSSLTLDDLDVVVDCGVDSADETIKAASIILSAGMRLRRAMLNILPVENDEKQYEDDNGTQYVNGPVRSLH